MKDNNDSIFSDFKKTELSEYFYKNKHMLGFSYPAKSLIIVTHELLTNSIDNCVEAKIDPVINIKIKYDDEFKNREDYKNHIIFEISDNGTGIPKKLLPTIFSQLLQGSKFNVNKQHMGQQGIGASAVVLFSNVTTGKMVELETTYNGTKYNCSVGMDIHSGKSLNKILSETKVSSCHGTKIKVYLADVSYTNGATSVPEYLKLIYLANPFITLNFESPEEKINYKKITEMSKPPEKELPHPLGLTAHDIISLFQGSKHTTLNDFLLKDLQRTSKQMLASLEEKTKLDFSKITKNNITFKNADAVVNALKTEKLKKPITENLMPIGEETLLKSLKSLYNPDFSVVVSRPAKVFNGGIPFEVEVGLGWSGECGKKDANTGFYDYTLLRFANRVPLLFDMSHDVSYKIMKDFKIQQYIKLENKNIPMSIIINVNSSNVPFTGPSKMAIDNIDEIEKEITLALQEGFRKISAFVNKRHKEEYEANAKSRLSKYVEIIAENLEEISNKKYSKDSIKKHLEKIIKER